MNLGQPEQARQALVNAQLALKEGRHIEARAWASSAARLDPGLEAPWLILASLASPRASVEYLQRALQVNPGSQEAIRGLEWALSRLEEKSPQKHVSSLGDTAPVHLKNQGKSNGSSRKIGKTQPIKIKKTGKPASPRPIRSRWLPVIIGIVMLLCLLAAGFMAYPRWIALANTNYARRPADALEKPTLTPTPTATFTPTTTFTPTPTPTMTPTLTPTPTPSPTPTESFAPYYGRDTIYEEPSIDNDGRWIDIDLSSQTVYAYEDKTIVNSFLVSTGTWAHPTVTGQFQIYAKYPSTLMVGPDYYLPGVPYTMYFYKGYALHGTYWHNNFGTPMSHGCVNLRTPDAEWLYNWADLGTLVNVHD